VWSFARGRVVASIAPEPRRLATCRCHGADALITVDCLVSPYLELGQHFQPSRVVASFDIPTLKVFDQLIRCALDEVFRLPQRCRRRRCRPPRSSCRQPLPPEPPDARPRRAVRTCGDSGPRTCAVRNRYAMEALGSLEDPEDRLPEAQSQRRHYG
jgi:hypothetical protein